MCSNSSGMAEDSPSHPKLPRLRPLREKFVLKPKQGSATLKVNSSTTPPSTTLPKEPIPKQCDYQGSFEKFLISKQPMEIVQVKETSLLEGSLVKAPALQEQLLARNSLSKKLPPKQSSLKGTSLKPTVKAPALQEVLVTQKLSKNLPQKKSPTEKLLPKEPPNLPNPDLAASEPMTFYPSFEELSSFDTYVAFMERQGAAKAGIARIVPPKNRTARRAGYDPADVDFIIDHPVKQNIAITKVPGAFTTIADRSIPPFTLPEYLRLATSPKYLTPSHSLYEELEDLYWKENQDASLPSPIYGADVQASLTDPDQTVFNLPKLPSIISGMAEQIPGVNLPYLYVGMWKATFSWHVEDMDLYAINFLYYGASKTWYCVPPQYGYKLEQLAQRLFPEMTETCFNLLRHKAVMIGPKLLRAHGIPFNKMVHEQGTIMVVFPHAYHSGFNHGFNMAESLNFALPRWVEYGKRFRDCLCSDQKRAVRVNMDQFVEKFQPDRLEKWRKGEDFALHPEDPEFMKMYYEDLKMRAEHGFIEQETFEILKSDLMMKRAISPWFKEKFSVEYSDVLEQVVEENISKKTLVDNANEDENANEISSMYVENMNNRILSESYVKMKCLDEEIVAKHLDELKAYEAILEEQRLNHEEKTADVKIGGAGGGCGFKGVNKEDLKAKKSLMLCSAKRKHRFKACSKCPGCLETNCEVCVYCLDSPRNGGSQLLKQKCVKRLCVNPVMATCGSCK